LPETSENRTIEIYEAEEFPWRWRLHRTLMSGVRAVDSTLHEHEGLWWMFTCLEDAVPNRDLYLYSATDPVNGDWTAHPGNPVVSDARWARPAGRIFRDGDSYIRPAQDCSDDYGVAVALRRILRLNEREYAEEFAGRLGPERVAGAEGLHTWNADAGLHLMDVRRRVPRWRLC
jgi:hypothetical protein